jgi:hypothetical protein
MSEPATEMSDGEVTRAKARANLLLALYSHVAHDLEQTRAEADRLRLELGALRGHFEETRRHLGEARAEVEGVHSQLNQTMNERDRLAVRVAELQQQHDAVVASTSWRITAPIRAVTRVMKR